MKPCLAVLGLLLISCNALPTATPSSSSNPYWIHHQDIRIISSDHLHHLYLVDADDKIIQLDSNGRQLHEVTYKSLGRVHSLDTDNPFKLFVFYRDQQTIVYLDNTLSELRRIEFKNWDLQDITAACLGAENSIWLFDGTSRVLKKYDDNGHLLISSDPFDFNTTYAQRPDRIQDIDHELILKESGKPALVFSDFGVFVRQLPDAVPDNFVINEGDLIYPEGDSIMLYHMKDNIISGSDFSHSVCVGCYILPYNGQLLSINSQGIVRSPFQPNP